ncbi:MAG TPA: ATP-binding protein [Streptomyces sp.]|uniref:ATP-binding protein n=1 Tax=Streptomyces sp. TaxID=1931 RepID=UPI002D2D1C68|nr:ATP-binding protein [Streptomyces sp.]HZG04643.1 ATP-binding protein [Streptomyces sp.]
MSIWWSLHLRREAASVPLARRLLLGAMEVAGVDPDVSYDLSVALSEACANAVEHGGPVSAGTSGAGEFHVTAYLDDDMCRIEVTDHGPGFERVRGGASGAAVPGAPTARDGFHDGVHDGAHASEHGRGLFLIEALADHVDFRSRPGNGAVVCFDKLLKWRKDALLRVC